MLHTVNVLCFLEEYISIKKIILFKYNPINFHVFKADTIVFPCSNYEIQFPSRKIQ